MITNRTKPGSSPVKQFTLVKEGIAGKIYIDPKGRIMTDYIGWPSLLPRMCIS